MLDDYHLLDGSAEAVLFLETLFAAAPLNVLIASRRRPAWVTTRHVLYGEIFELGQSALAMSRAILAKLGHDISVLAGASPTL